MANNPVVNTLTFTGSVAGQATIQAQGIAGGLTFLLPNTVPNVNQLLTATAVNGNNVFLGWSSAQSLSNIPLSALSPAGATNGDVVQLVGGAWTFSAFVPGAGTVTSVAFTTPAELSIAGSPITTSGTLALSWASGTGVGAQAKVIATQFNESVAALRSGLESDVTAAGVKALEMVTRIEQADRRPIVLRWMAMAFASALALFAAGIVIGAWFLHS